MAAIRRLRWLAVVGAFVAAPAALAWDSELWDFVCPICGTKFESAVNAHYSTYGTGDEANPIANGPIFAYMLHTCPKDYYTAFGEHFQAGSRTPTMVDGMAIVKALGEFRKTHPLPPPDNLYPLEKYALAEVCELVRKAPAEELRQLYLYAAWLADESGEVDLAADYRRKALPQLQIEARAAKPLENREPLEAVETQDRFLWDGLGDAVAQGDAWYARFRYYALLRTLGESNKSREGFENLVKDLQQELGILRPELEKVTAERKKAYYDKPPEELVYHIKMLTGLLDFTRQQLLAMTYTELGEEKSLERARGGDLAEKLAFLHVYSDSGRPQTIEAIREWYRFQATRTTIHLEGGTIYLEGGPPSAADAEIPPLPLRNRWPADVLIDAIPKARAHPKEEPSLFEQPEVTTPEDLPIGRLVEMVAEEGTPAAANALLKDMQAHLSWYLVEHTGWLLGSYQQPTVYQAMSADPQAALAAAKAVLARLATKGISDGEATVAFRPLAFTNDQESLEFLLASLDHGAPKVRLAAQTCLILRGRPEGKNAYLSDIAAMKGAPPDLPEDAQCSLVRLVDKSDYDRLEALVGKKFNRIFVRFSIDPTPRKIEEVLSDDTPLWVHAAMAAANPARGESQFEKLITSDPERIAEADPQEVARYARYYCTPRMLKRLLVALEPESRGWGFGEIAMAAAETRAPEVGQAFARLLQRPTPGEVKIAIAEAAPQVPIPGIKPLLVKWSQCRNKELAAVARKALACGIAGDNNDVPTQGD